MLSVEALSVITASGADLLRDVSLGVASGEAVGLTGASGAGKTTLVKSIMGILDRNCRITGGDIVLDGEALGGLPPKRRRALGGRVIGFVPQSPMTAFDPRIPVGRQMAETLQVGLHLSRTGAERLAADALARLNLPDVERVRRSLPGELSGGMLQRVAVALLLAMEPGYILADEPTSALDPENRELLLSALEEQRRRAGILFVSHDVEALKSLCGRVYVMEAGAVSEISGMADLMEKPGTEWTRAFASAYSEAEEGEWKWTSL